jgi:two-component system response regulator VicR
MAKRILVIDDDEDILEILNIIFQDEGYDVIISNTAEAANHIHEIHPDIVLLDVRITGSLKTGAEICEEIRLQYRAEELPVILVSAETDIAVLALHCGADAYVAKPFDIYDLIITVKECLS